MLPCGYLARVTCSVKLLDGRALAQEKLESLKKKFSSLPFTPGLGVVLVGNDAASHLYVSIKEREARKLGIYFEKVTFPVNAKEEDVIEVIKTFNTNKHIHGILVQLPLPASIHTGNIINTIAQDKDVDGFFKNSSVVSPLIQAILALLHATGVSLKGLKAALLIKNDILYRDLALFLIKEEIEIIGDCQKADIIVVAKGKPSSLTQDMVKAGSIIIDVGTTKTKEGFVGDTDTSVKAKAGFFTPVPGGVGPLTVAYLFQNLLMLSKRGLNSRDTLQSP